MSPTRRRLFFSCMLVATALTLTAAEEGNVPAKPAAKKAFSWVNGDAPEWPGVRHGAFHSAINAAEIGYYICLPPGYDEEANREKRYPVVYFLHGDRPGNERRCVHLAETIWPAMTSGRVPPMIYVFVNGGVVSHYDYPALHSYGESAFVKELVPHIDGRYRTIATREGRGVEGFSQGGRAAPRIAFKFPELFGTCVAMSGGHQHEKHASENNGAERPAGKNAADRRGLVFEPKNNTYDLAREYAQNKMKAYPVRFLVAVSEADFNYAANLAWMEHLAAQSIPFEKILLTKPEHASGAYYEEMGERAMRFHAARGGEEVTAH